MIHPVFPFRPRPRLAARGSTLAATMMVVAAIASFLSIAALVTSQSGRFASSQQGKSDQIAACDAALEYAYAQWKAVVSTAVQSGGGTMPKASACGPSPTSANPMWSRFNAVYGNSGAFAASTGVVAPTPTPGTTQYSLYIKAVDQSGANPTDDVYAGVPTSNVPGYPGWTGQTYYYKATATVTNSGRYGASGFVSASRYFQVTRVPLFQAAIFYENKLEIHPGAAMVVTGLVHTNGDLWAQGFNNLQFKSNVSYVGAFHQDADSTVTTGWDGYYNYYNLKSFPGDSQKVSWADGSQYTDPSKSTNQLNLVSPIDPFGGATTSNNGLHDIIDVPAAGNNSNQIAYNNASLIITVNTGVANNATGRYTITDGNGVALTGTNYTNVLAAIGGSTSNSVTTTSTITDMREASTVTLTNLDMAKLATATVSATPNTWQAQFAAKPTVYIRDVGATGSGVRRAVRLVNGRTLGQNVSVASDGGVYIQGDYNTGGSSASDVPSNAANAYDKYNSTNDSNDLPSPNAANKTRYTSSVMADAVTILSNNWNDANSGNRLAGTMGGSSTTGRVATPTTVNTAILAGDVPSNLNNNGIASGGAHNFPRFLENWSDKNFTYYGSLVEAFRSEKFTGLWQTGNVYTWPNRMWNFDTNFVNNPPPGAPAGMQLSRGRYERITNLTYN